MGSKNPSLLIDADIILHKVACVTEKVIDWGDEITTAQCSLSDASSTVTQHLYHLQDRFEDHKLVLVASSTTNFRKDLWPDYKGHRTQRKPVGYGLIKGWLQQEYGLVIVPGLEADDVIGIMATSPKFKDAVMVSTDKDFKSIPGKLYNPDRDELVETNEYSADKYHMYQTLIGDPADGYKGCPGIGAIKAEQMLENEPPEKWWGIIRTAYEAKGLTEEDALLNARMARILRRTDWDAAKKEPILWVPNSGRDTSTSVSTAASTATRPATCQRKRRNARR